MKKVTFLASLLLLIGSTAFAQNLTILNGSEPVTDGQTLVGYELDEMGMIMAPFVVKNGGSGSVEASLTVTLLECTDDGGVGYCGWGTDFCAALDLENTPVVKRTTTLNAGDVVDPKIEAMGPPTYAKIKCELNYGATKTTIYVKFDPNYASISSAKTGKNVVVNSRGGIADVNYNFDAEGARTLNIYNVTGKLVATKLISGMTGNVSLSLNKGVYLYSIVEKGRVTGTSKFSVN